MEGNETKDKFKELIKDLAESSAFHGVSKIAVSKSIWMRILWILALATAAGIAFYQLWKLFVLYSSSPISTTVTLEFNQLPFPAVSFCNLNPVRWSQESNLSQSLRTMLGTAPLQDDTSEETTNSSDWWDYYSSADDYVITYDDDESSLIESDISNIKDTWIRRIEDFKVKFVSQPVENRKLQGHQIKDMLLQCSFGSMKCFTDNFTLYQSPDYGNCYTFQPGRVSTRRPGPLYGLSLTINLEAFEYLHTYATASGSKLVIHEPGSQPLFLDEGITLGAQKETFIGIKMVNISRLGEPHGKCEDGVEFKKNYNITYSLATCMSICRYKAVMGSCNCSPVNVPISVIDAVRFCSETVEEDRKCMRKIENEINEGDLKCGCHKPCSEVVYDKTLSSIDWPGREYLENVLMRNLCDKNLTYVQEICSRLTNLTDDPDLDEYYYNFLRVNVYYENMNFENIVEDPLYDEFRFMSDIGGTLGLFIGASLLSFFELIQFLIEIGLFFCKWKSNPKATKVQSIDTKQPLSGT